MTVRRAILILALVGAVAMLVVPPWHVKPRSGPAAHIGKGYAWITAPPAPAAEINLTTLICQVAALGAATTILYLIVPKGD